MAVTRGGGRIARKCLSAQGVIATLRRVSLMVSSSRGSVEGLPVHIAWLWVGSLASRLGWTGMSGLVLCSHNGGYCAEAHE